MYIKMIEIKGFLSYQYPVQINLDKDLYLITSEGRSNGVGKTAIFDAILWALYGKTTRGILKDELINRNTNEARVKIILEVYTPEIVEIIAIRSRRRGESDKLDLWVNGKQIGGINKDLEEYLAQYIGTFREAVNTFYMPQGQLELFNTTEARRASLLLELLDVTRIERAYKLVLEDNRTLKQELEYFERNIEEMHNKCAELMDNIKEVNEKMQKYEYSINILDIQQHKVEMMEKEMSEIIQRYTQYMKNTQQLEQIKQKVKKNEELIAKTRQYYREMIARLNNEYRECEEQLSTIGAFDKNNVRNQIAQKGDNYANAFYNLGKVEGLPPEMRDKRKIEEMITISSNAKNDFYQTLSLIDKIRTVDDIKRLQKKMQDIQEELEKVEDKHRGEMARIEEEQHQLQGMLDNLKQKIEEEDLEIDEETIKVKQEEIEKLRREIKKLEQVRQEYMELKGHRDGYLNMLREAQEKLSQLQQDKQVFETEINLMADVAQVLGVDGLQKHYIHYVLTQLEENINEWFEKVDVNLRVKWVLNKDNLTLYVDDGIGERRYEACSAGEKAMIALAFRLILTLFKNFGVILIDEAFAHLDEDNRMAITDFLVRFNKKAQRQMLIISHDREVKEMIDNCIVVEKDVSSKATVKKRRIEGEIDIYAQSER